MKYVNKKSGDVSWEKPKALGTEDIDVSPRSRVAAEKAGVKVEKNIKDCFRFCYVPIAEHRTPEIAHL